MGLLEGASFVCTCVPIRIHASVRADTPEMYSRCVHGLVHKLSDTWHPRVSQQRTNTTCFSSPSLPLPAGTAAPPQGYSTPFEPIPACFPVQRPLLSSCSSRGAAAEPGLPGDGAQPRGEITPAPKAAAPHQFPELKSLTQALKIVI